MILHPKIRFAHYVGTMFASLLFWRFPSTDDVATVPTNDGESMSQANARGKIIGIFDRTRETVAKISKVGRRAAATGAEKAFEIAVRGAEHAGEALQRFARAR